MDYVNSGHVTAYGPGLIHGVVNKPAGFTVNTKDAGDGIVFSLKACTLRLIRFIVLDIDIDVFFVLLISL